MLILDFTDICKGDVKNSFWIKDSFRIYEKGHLYIPEELQKVKEKASSTAIVGSLSVTGSKYKGAEKVRVYSTASDCENAINQHNRNLMRKLKQRGKKQKRLWVKGV